MSIFEKSLNTLELPEVLKKLANEAVSETAKELCLSLKPSCSAEEVQHNLEQTNSAYRMIVSHGSPGFSSLKDVRAYLNRAELGGSLNTRELLDISNVLRCARLVKSYRADNQLEKSAVDYLFNALHANKFLEEKITNSITGDDEIADSASPELSDIRRKIRAASARAREALNKIISSPSYAKALQENIITTRSGRFVVPVKAECRNQIPGLVHDTSATGATLFIEPMAAVKANNELRELASKEKTEIERILAELSADCASHSDDISSDFSCVTQLDFIFAKAKLSFTLDCCPAETSGRNIILKNARHPLLDKKTAVPINLEFGKDVDTLIITGPNTGGKTVSLKTLGLLAAMNQCGLHIPAGDGSALPVFTNILADIGDEQSIEQSLSTFSAHMVNIVNILNECGENSLVLFDELGAGTDPVEGAALAVSIIENVRKSGAICSATTHYTELKIYASNEPGVLNASCEFDVETLKPTYRLLIGIPGKSNAFAISQRLGLSESIINDAKKHIESGNADFEATVEKLEETRRQMEKERDEIRTKLREAQDNAKKAAMLKAEHEVRLEKAEIKARRESQAIIDEARSAAERVFAELDEMKKKSNEDEELARINEARNALRRSLNDAENSIGISAHEEDTRESARPVAAGDIVEIRRLGLKAEVLSVSEDRVLSLKAGAMYLNARENEVLLLEDQKPVKKSNPKPTGVLRSESAHNEIDLRGYESLEAVAMAEAFIDNAVIAKLPSVTIIHGKGTGALRKAVQQMLKHNKCVKSFRLGTFGEGESGVTIVELK